LIKDGGVLRSLQDEYGGAASRNRSCGRARDYREKARQYEEILHRKLLKKNNIAT
jgi:hypothetical protein